MLHADVCVSLWFDRNTDFCDEDMCVSIRSKIQLIHTADTEFSVTNSRILFLK